MLQLALILLTGELPEGFKLSQPGTVSKATRLMNRYSSQYGKTGFPEETNTYAIEEFTLVQTLLGCEAFQILWYVAEEFTGE